LQAPVRAEDAAIVPISVRALIPQTPERFIRRIRLVIDNNPSPFGVTVEFTPLSGRADFETRVRVEEYTFVRAIAELNDGRLVMDTRFVKASGGCSAPAGKDAAEALANLGRMRLKVEPPAAPGEPAVAQLMVSHPNISGLAIDQLTRLAPQPRFVRRVDVSFGNQPLLSADVDFTLSENPHLRFRVQPREPGDLKVVVTDTASARFETHTSLAPV
jgi:sulfur-oxidizing protein SoxY